VLHTMQALIAALRAFCNDRVQMLQSMFASRLCASACAARVCMAGCSKAPHPAMRQRSCPAPRVKGTLRRAAPALDTRLRARHALAFGMPQADLVRPPCPAGLADAIYHPKGVTPTRVEQEASDEILYPSAQTLLRN
jgi:hypothetical protein